MSDTIFYSIKLKKNKTPKQVFEKIQKKVKPKGVTSKWNVSEKEETLIIDFGDDKSETFCLQFENKQADGFCKVGFPLDGDLFENEKKSEWKTFIAMLHSLKPMCTDISVTDDYSIAEEYFASLDYDFDLRVMKPEEVARVEAIWSLGITDYEEMLLKIFAEDTEREYPFDKKAVLHPLISLRGDVFPTISGLWETYLYETSVWKKKCLREIYLDDVRIVDGRTAIYGDPPADVMTFALGLGMLFAEYDTVDNTWGRGANVTKYYYDKFLPVFEKADAKEKCMLVYQFMVSLYQYCKFSFVGKEMINEKIAQYEKPFNQIKEIYEMGNKEAEKGNFEQALKYYEEAYNQIPDEKERYEVAVWIKESIGDIFWLQKNLEQAEKYYKEAFSAGRIWNYPSVDLKMGRCLCVLGKEKEALFYLKNAYRWAGESIFNEDLELLKLIKK